MLVTYTDAQVLICTLERGKENLITRSQERLFNQVSFRIRQHATCRSYSLTQSLSVESNIRAVEPRIAEICIQRSCSNDLCVMSSSYALPRRAQDLDRVMYIASKRKQDPPRYVTLLSRASLAHPALALAYIL